MYFACTIFRLPSGYRTTESDAIFLSKFAKIALSQLLRCTTYKYKHDLNDKSGLASNKKTNTKDLIPKKYGKIWPQIALIVL